jgi:hypothetical protein
VTFHWFAEATYDDLPEVFPQRHQSGSVDHPGIGQLITCMHMGNLPEETAAMNNALSGTQVAPYLRDLWADHEDHWTPVVSQHRDAAHAPRIPVPSRQESTR